MPGKKASFRTAFDRRRLLAMFDDISDLAKRESTALGFIPFAGMQSAIEESRLFAVVDEASDGRLAGYLFFGGVFPTAKVHQIAVDSEYRREGVGSGLLATLTSMLEERGYLSITAEIRDDLPEALSFYRRNGFRQVAEKPGGKTRDRMILIHAKELESDNLFNIGADSSPTALASNIHRLAMKSQPRFALDLNVYFDLAKRRKDAEYAEALFRASFEGIVRINVATEFVAELRAQSRPNKPDPILNLALCIPRLPPVGVDDLAALRDEVHKVVFEDQRPRSAGTRQAMSDCRHIAHSALAQCTAFVTRDSTILAANEELRSKFGLDIISPQELFALLPNTRDAKEFVERGEGFITRSANSQEAIDFLAELNVSTANYGTMFDLLAEPKSVVEAVEDEGRIRALSVRRPPQSIGEFDTLAIACRPEEPNRQLYVGYLLDHALSAVAQDNPSVLRLARIPGQSTVNEQARARGFIKLDQSMFEKPTIGRPITPKCWLAKRTHLLARSGISLPEEYPSDETTTVAISSGAHHVRILPSALESLLGPTIIWWPDRSCVIASIKAGFAEELLGTGQNQRFDFIESRDAMFLRRRGYVSTPRNATKLNAGAILFFYESSKGGGRSAIVAVAKIVSSSILDKRLVNEQQRSELVVDDLDGFSSTQDVLLTQFEDLFLLDVPTKLDELRLLGIADGANFVSAKAITADQGRLILERGFQL